MSQQDIEHGVNIYRKACREYPETPDGQWNIELNNLAGLAGRLVAAGCFDEDFALNLATESGAAYVKDNRKAFLATFKSGFKWGLKSPWVPLGPEDVGFAGGSFMSSTTTWAVAGPVIALAGLALIALARRRRRSR